MGSAETLLDIAECASAQEYRAQIAAEGQRGLRHLAIAYGKLGATEPTDVMAQEQGLLFLGFVTLADPLRASTPHAVAMAQKLGVAIKVLTGDSKEVAAYVARQVGLLPEGSVVYTGDELAKLSATPRARRRPGMSSCGSSRGRSPRPSTWRSWS